MKEPRQVRIRFYEDREAICPPGYYLNSLLYVNNRRKTRSSNAYNKQMTLGIKRRGGGPHTFFRDLFCYKMVID